jgi:hypothetical protein
VGDLVPFIIAVAAFAGVGIVAGMLIARRIDAWDASRDEPDDKPSEPPEDRAP